MTILACAALALLLSLGGPRRPGLLLSLVALAIVCGLSSLALLGSPISILLFALLAGAGLFLALLLPRVLARLFIALFALVALPLGPTAALGKAGLVAASAVALALLFFAVKRPAETMRLACAGAGGLVLSLVLPHQHLLGWRLAVTALLLVLEALVRRFLWPERERTPVVVQVVASRAAALGVAGMLLVLALPFLAPPPGAPIASERPDLPPLPYAERRARLGALAPQGGLVWPLPSEAIFWDEPNLDRALFPWFDNLDALFLGVRTKGLVALPPSDGSLRVMSRISLHKPIAESRLNADPPALARLRAAAQATTAALRDILPLIKPGARESDLEPALKAAMRAHGCGAESFPLIFASGPSAAEPHGSGNAGTLQPDTLLVADVGCFIDHYASDFTRTLPVSGRFTPRQKLLYDNVFAAQAAALAQCKPGVFLSRGPSEVSMDATAREVLKARATDHQAHMIHDLGHTVGLFVHDIWMSGPLARGNVITIEPGTYLPGELGIRIEDTFLVDGDGCERLTTGFPAESDAIEAALVRHQASP